MPVARADNFRYGVAEAERRLRKKLRPYRIALFHEDGKQVFTTLEIAEEIKRELREEITIVPNLTTAEKVILGITHPFTMLVAWYYLNKQNEPTATVNRRPSHDDLESDQCLG